MDSPSTVPLPERTPEWIKSPASKVWHYTEHHLKGENIGPIVVLIVGVALRIFRYALSVPLIANSITFFCAKLVINKAREHHVDSINSKIGRLRKVVSDYPRVRHIMFIFSLLICKKFPKLSLLTAGVAGFLAAVAIGIVKPIERDADSNQGASLF